MIGITQFSSIMYAAYPVTNDMIILTKITDRLLSYMVFGCQYYYNLFKHAKREIIRCLMTISFGLDLFCHALYFYLLTILGGLTNLLDGVKTISIIHHTPQPKHLSFQVSLTTWGGCH